MLMNMKITSSLNINLCNLITLVSVIHKTRAKAKIIKRIKINITWRSFRKWTLMLVNFNKLYKEEIVIIPNFKLFKVIINNSNSCKMILNKTSINYLNLFKIFKFLTIIHILIINSHNPNALYLCLQSCHNLM